MTLVSEIEALGGTAAMLALDVTKVASFPAFAASFAETLRSRFGSDRFDYLVNNAGAVVHVQVADASEEQFDMMIDMHLRGPVFLTQALLPVHRRWRTHPQRLVGLHAHVDGQLRPLCGGQGGAPDADPVHGARTRRAADPRQRHRARCHRHRFRRWPGPRRRTGSMPSSRARSRSAAPVSPMISVARSQPSCPMTWAGPTALPSMSRVVSRSDLCSSTIEKPS